MPKLSVIIPVCNASAILRETLDSVLTQSLTDLELICVDEGSTDNSLEILREYKEKESRVLVLTQQNQFAGAARNNGLMHASGDYVHFLSVGDKVLPYSYEAITNKAVKFEPDILRFPVLCWDDGQEACIRDVKNSCDGMRSGEYNRLLSRDKANPVFRNILSAAPWALICRRAFLLEKNIRFSDLRCCSGRSFYWACVTNTDRTIICRDRAVIHRISRRDEFAGSPADDFDDFLRSIAVITERMEADGIVEELQKAVLSAEFAEFADRYVSCITAASDESAEQNSAPAEAFAQNMPEVPDGEAERIYAAAETFVTNYAGLCVGLLREKYMDALRRSARVAKEKNGQNTAQKTARKIIVFYEACAEPKVSVVVPIYNVEDYLNEALDSLQAQKLKDMEFILVNDGSTDGSLAIMREYEALDKRFRILDGPNGGYGKAMNCGLDAARGKYIGILEPDDFVPAQMYRDLYLIAEQNQVDFVKTDHFGFRVNKNGTLKKERIRLAGFYAKACYNRVICPAENIDTFKFVLKTWSGIYSRNFLNRHHIRHNETPGASYQDNGFYFQTFCLAERAYFVDKPYYMYRRDNPGASVYNRKKIYCMTDEYRFIREFLEKEPGMMERFGGIFCVKMFDSFAVTYWRLAREYQKEYLYHIRDEFREPMETGLVDRKLFSDVRWMALNEIVKDPDAYFERVRVSVIMPAFNREEDLREALDNLLSFNETTFEIICADDGLSDAASEILREYEGNDDRVHIIRSENAGAGAARNAGIAFARGAYLAFPDAGYIYDTETVRRAFERAQLTEADIVVVGSDQYIEETGEYIPMSGNIRRDLLPPGQVFAASEIRQNLFGVFAEWSGDKLFRADFVRENGLHFQELHSTDGATDDITEDRLFVLAALAKAQRISVIYSVLAHRRKASLTRLVTHKNSRECFYEALCELREQLKCWDLYETREQDFINYCLHVILQSLDSLHSEAYFQFYENLRREWLAGLGVLILANTPADTEARYIARPTAYYYNENEYADLTALLSLSAVDYLFRRNDKAIAQQTVLEQKNIQLQEKLDRKTTEIWEQGLLRSRDRQNIRELKKVNSRAEKKNARLSEKNTQLKAELKREKAERSRLKNSSIWKWGRVVTWPFRKLKRLFQRKQGKRN